MCGISGVYLPRGGVTANLVGAMAACMRHRGPDYTGLWASDDGRIGLGHNRLSILDLSPAGHQPMAAPDGRCRIVFNGEIYNFPDLRRALELRGHHFRSQGDTEVLLALYAEYGEAMLPHLNGMFAFCIHDPVRNLLFAARDRAGVKPFYYSLREGAFGFASEPKALLELPFVSRELDPSALDAYFTLGYVPDPLCIFRDIAKLPPGHSLTMPLAGGAPVLRRYWTLPAPVTRNDAETEADHVARLEELLRDAIRMRLVSDVPVGCFLSGGIDSSLVATLMARECPSPINTFTIRFTNSRFDESPYARLVAEAIGSRHTEETVDMNAAEALHHLSGLFDEPFADSSMIPTYYVSKVARQQVTVVLSGDGGDELFGGYNWYSWLLALQHWRSRLGPLAHPIGALARHIPGHWPGRHLLGMMDQSATAQLLDRIGVLGAGLKTELYGEGLLATTGMTDAAAAFAGSFEALEGDLLRRLTETDFHNYLPGDILTKVDRASMAVSLEARTPWLDYRLVEYAYALPSSWRIRAGRKKYLPKRLAQSILPAALPLERKQGFCIPLQDWMGGDLGTMLEEALADNALHPYLSTKGVRSLLHAHRHDPGRRLGAPLFAILTFALWRRRFHRV